MLLKLAWRMMRTTEPRLAWKLLRNLCWGGIRSIQKFERRTKRNVYFPPFLFLSVANSCNLRCQGCWVSVDAPRAFIPTEELVQLIGEAKRYGNRFFGILGGEPLLHPDLESVFRAHPDCYFQVFTNGQLVTREVAAHWRRLGNVTPLISVEGNEVVSDQRRGGNGVYGRTLRGLEHCVQQRLITGVATSVCRSNLDLVSESWLDRLIQMGVHYCWFYTYRPVGPNPSPELALSPPEQLSVRRFVVEMRKRKPIILVDAYWDEYGRAMCPAAVGLSHHVNPWGEIEPCPVIQFATDTIYDNGSVFRTMTQSRFLDDFRRTTAATTRGCIVLERPDLLHEIVRRHSAADATHRAGPGDGFAELAAMQPRPSQHDPDNQVPEDHWLYRFAKRHWFFGFGAYS
jgi:MoaA/NifB/PqqE/SkfB family radical SAM enzyme